MSATHIGVIGARERLFGRLADVREEHQEELALLETLDTGIPIRQPETNSPSGGKFPVFRGNGHAYLKTMAFGVIPRALPPPTAATLLTGVRLGMRVREEEIFGPGLAVTPFDTEDEGLSIPNGVRYGLGLDA